MSWSAVPELLVRIWDEVKGRLSPQERRRREANRIREAIKQALADGDLERVVSLRSELDGVLDTSRRAED